MSEYYEFTVSLLGSKPKLWRKFQLKKTATFQDLHQAIQDACGWDNCHLFSFSIGMPYKSTRIAICTEYNDYDGDESVPTARRVKLISYFEEQSKCTYLYDFGDDWVHEVKCKPIVVDSRFKRRLIAGKGTFPPEDCGGIWGYYECLNAVEGKKTDKNNLKKWLGDWHPNNFSLQVQKNVFDQ